MFVGAPPSGAGVIGHIASGFPASAPLLLPELLPLVLPELLPDVLPLVLPELLPDVLPLVLPDVPPEVLPDVLPEVLPELPLLLPEPLLAVPPSPKFVVVLEQPPAKATSGSPANATRLRACFSFTASSWAMAPVCATFVRSGHAYQRREPCVNASDLPRQAR
jgi:hypothetical protein